MKIPPNKVGADHTLNLIVIKVADIGEYRQKKTPRMRGFYQLKLYKSTPLRFAVDWI